MLENDAATTESTSLIPRCPICASRLNKVYDSDLECECWVCSDPDCGYIMPILPE